MFNFALRWGENRDKALETWGLRGGGKL